MLLPGVGFEPMLTDVSLGTYVKCVNLWAFLDYTCMGSLGVESLNL